jgi:uncharacterized membrane protein YbaN (DUF454 family)
MNDICDLLIKIIDVVLRVLNAAFFITIAWCFIKERKK